MLQLVAVRGVPFQDEEAQRMCLRAGISEETQQCHCELSALGMGLAFALGFPPGPQQPSCTQGLSSCALPSDSTGGEQLCSALRPATGS